MFVLIFLCGLAIGTFLGMMLTALLSANNNNEEKENNSEVSYLYR